MSIRKKLCIAVMCITICAMLAACVKEPIMTESDVWGQMPELTYGIMEYEKLDVLPWNSGRCEATSHNSMAETAEGYYGTHFSRLYYSDKSDSELWVPVCNDPDCSHVSLTNCNACLVTGTFLLHGGRIFFEEFAGKNPHLYSGNQSSMLLVSTKKDGTDKQLAYAIKDDFLDSNVAGGGSTILTPHLWIYTASKFNADGSVATRVYKVDETGQHILSEKVEQNENTSSGRLGGIYGDPYLLISAMSTESLLYIQENAIHELEMSKIPDNGGYISGRIIRYFVENDGYYDYDIATGNMIKLADSQIEDSTAVIILPNCVVESTILNEEYSSNVKTHTMRIFDGTCWKDVKMPPKLQIAEKAPLLTLRAVTSDSIIFSHTENVMIEVDDTTYNYLDLVLYRVMINREEWELEYYARVQQPRELPK